MIAAVIVLGLLCLALMVAYDRQGVRHARERAMLLQRIQAPERAVRAQEPVRHRRPAPSVSLEDDEAMIAAEGGRVDNGGA